MKNNKHELRPFKSCLRLAFICVLVCGSFGCGYTLTGGMRVGENEPNPNYFEPLLGPNATLYGVVNLSGHIAPSIKTPEGPAYLFGKDSRPWKPDSQELQGKSVSATGVLRYHAWSTKNPHKYYYLEVETIQPR